MKASDLFDVRGRVAVVTGAASGLGFAIAEVLADNGARVVMADRDRERLSAASERLRADGGDVEPLDIDIAEHRRLQKAMAEIAGRHGRLDAVFANAGVSAGPGFAAGPGRLDAVDLAEWERVLAINLTGVLATIQAASLPMKAQRQGRIVVTASIAGLRAEPLVGYAYVAAKAAVINLVRQAAIELAPHNVLVNAIAPGPFRTNIAGGRLRDPAVVKQFAELVPLGRIAEPDEIKGLALLLASPACSFMTGAVIAVDGGLTAG